MREDDTGKKSFDFTGELNRLNQGGVGLSFVEQLEEAFNVSFPILAPHQSRARLPLPH